MRRVFAVLHQGASQVASGHSASGNRGGTSIDKREHGPKDIAGLEAEINKWQGFGQKGLCDPHLHGGDRA
jgi:hypothetical protein